MVDLLRREYLTISGVAFSIVASGCLRLTQSDSNGRTETDTTPQPTTQLATSPMTISKSKSPTETSSTEIDSPSESSSPERSTPTKTIGNSIELSNIHTLEQHPDILTHFKNDFYIGTIGSSIFRMTVDGKVRWKSSINIDLYSIQSLTFTQNMLYSGWRSDNDSNGAKAIAIRRETGDKIWEFTTKDDGLHTSIDSLDVIPSELLVVGNDGTGSGSDQEPLVYGIDISSGEQKWVTSDFEPTFIETVFIYNNSPYVVTLDGVYQIDAESGSVTTVISTLTGFGRSTLDDGRLYTPGPNLKSIDLQSGSVKWSAETVGKVKTQPVVAGDRVFVGSETGFIYAFNTKKGEKIWENRLPAEVKDIEITTRLIWVTDDIGTLTALQRKTGKKVYEEVPEDGDSKMIETIGNNLIVGSSAVKIKRVQR